MAYFTKKTQMQKLQSDLDALKTRATLLNAKRVAAQLAFDKAVAARQTHLLGGDLDDEKISAKMQGAVDAGASTLAGLDVAIAALTASIAEAEQAIVAEAGRVKREADAKALAAVLASLEDKFAPWLQATRAIAADLESLNGFRWQSGQLAGFLRNVAGEAEIGLRVTLDDLAGSIPAVMAGTGNEKLRIGFEPLRPEPEPVPHELVFCLKPVKWRADNGQQCAAQRFADANLPAAIAARAISSGVCCALSDPRRKQNHGVAVGHPDLSVCVDLSGAAEPGQFEQLDRGPPYLATIKA
jgi:hypothetical protein